MDDGQSWRWCPIGTQAHQHNEESHHRYQPNPQISLHHKDLVEREAHRGCKLLIPVLLAIVPVMKGNAADPGLPKSLLSSQCSP